MSFLYETHMHTCQASACGVSTGREHVHYYKDIGYTGIIVTDHFFGGNTRIDRNLPWDQYVDGFWSGYEDALEEGTKVGLDVFFGLEQHYAGDEYLVYGLTKEFMKAHPEMPRWTRREQLAWVHRAGGCVIQAHPFRMRTSYMGRIRIGLDFCDGVEVANAGNEQLDDARCMLMAREKNLVTIAGSDNHRSPADERPVYGVELEEKLNGIGDFVSLILNHGPIGLHVPAERFVMPQVELDDAHRAYFLDAQEQDIPAGKEYLE